MNAIVVMEELGAEWVQASGVWRMASKKMRCVALSTLTFVSFIENHMLSFEIPLSHR